MKISSLENVFAIGYTGKLSFLVYFLYSLKAVYYWFLGFLKNFRASARGAAIAGKF